MMEHRPSSWVRLNGYGILIALLSVFTSVQYVLEPTGRVLAMVAHVGIGLAGLGLLHSYYLRRVDMEVYASVLLIAATTLDCIRGMLSTTPPAFDAEGFIIELFIIAAVGMRISALIEGGTFTLAQWSPPKRHRDES